MKNEEKKTETPKLTEEFLSILRKGLESAAWRCELHTVRLLLDVGGAGLGCEAVGRALGKAASSKHKNGKQELIDMLVEALRARGADLDPGWDAIVWSQSSKSDGCADTLKHLLDLGLGTDETLRFVAERSKRTGRYDLAAVADIFLERRAKRPPRPS